MTPNVLVTGSSGHLGCALVLALPSYGYHPIGIDILPSETTTHVGSVSDRKFVSDTLDSVPGSIQHVIHAATLHKPHVDSHPKEAFIDTNILGTLVLLEEVSKRKVQSFVFTSTTSAFGAALSPRPGMPAAWIDETVVPIPKNIYGVSKVAAEDLCHLVHKQTGMATLVLRTSRFFPEEDDDEDRRNALGDENLKLLELCYRRVDIADIVSACVCAMEKAEDVKWAKYIISGPTPFQNDETTLRRLDADAEALIKTVVPGCAKVFDERGWAFLPRMDRVYDSRKAQKELGWQPQYTFASAIEKIGRGEEWRSELAFRVGRRGYHRVPTGVYTT